MDRPVRGRAGRPPGSRRGTATVELALVLPTLIVLVFGAIEVGLLVRATLAVNHVANEAARAAAIGNTPAQIDACLPVMSPGINAQLITSTYTCRTWDADTQTWGQWVTLGSSGAENDAPRGSQIMVALHYPHGTVFGRLFGAMLHASEDGTISLSASMVTIRE